MKDRVTLLLAAAALGLATLDLLAPARGQAPAASAAAKDESDKDKKFEDFDKVVKGAKEHEGLFRLHQKDETVYAEIMPNQLDKMFLCPIAIARGLGLGGFTLNFDEQWVLVFKRVGDKVHLVRRNVRFQAKKDSPLATAVATTYTDSVLLALKIHAIHPSRQSLLINLNDIFMSDFAQLNLGQFDAGRSTWFKVKAFPRNIELEVLATYAGRGGSDDSVIDARGKTVVLHYGLTPLPEDGYQPRLADDRVGYFLSVVKDFSSDSRDSSFLRYVNRWRLERADGDPKNLARLSPPRKKIVFWIEKSVPDEYRAAVREGILEWNKAFAKIGFRDAIEVRQQENEDFDPEDINYNTFRWIATGQGFAMGPSRSNPLTGEILDADIIFDADMVRYWKQEFRHLGGGAAPAPLPPLSLIEATRKGWFLPDFRLPAADARTSDAAAGWNDRVNPLALLDNQRWAVRQGVCQCGPCKRFELSLAAVALEARGLLQPGEKVPEELIQQAVKETVMHEVGHTLGLRHNFKASSMLKNEQLHDTSITRLKGVSGSVMDYNPVNLAPKGVKQGDFFNTTIGPYDYWAIEYAYKPLAGGPEKELEELRQIAARGAMPGHDYGTDEDLFGTADPLINAWDLGADPLQFARDRLQLADELFKDLSERVVEKGEGYQRVRRAFNVLLGQYANAGYLAAGYVGGEYVHRDHFGDPDGRDPLVPVSASRQREALRFVQERILTDRPFQFQPTLLRRLAADRWWHWGNDHLWFEPVDYPLYEQIVRVQRTVLDNVLAPAVLSRIQNGALKARDEQPLTLAEVFRSLSDAVWADLPGPDEKGQPRASSVIRRNLQREHLKDLSQLLLGPPGRVSFLGQRSQVPPDARSLARLHLRDIDRKIERLLADKQLNLDDTTRAHLEECHERIGKVLTASLQLHEP